MELGDIKLWFCTFPEMKYVDRQSEFASLKDYIIESFDLNANVLDRDEGLETDKCIILAFTRMKNLCDAQVYEEFIQHPTRKPCTKYKLKTNFPKEFIPHPIILIGLEDLPDIVNDEQINNETNLKILKELNLDPRVNFFDSSIWQRYVPLNMEFHERMANVLAEILEHHQKELYKTIVACEFIEFQTRNVLNSFLAPICSGGHGKDITPYKFHSEFLMQKKAQAEWEVILKIASDAKWRFLLVDDYGDRHLRMKEGNIQYTKKDIINDLISFDSNLESISIENAAESPQDSDLAKENDDVSRGLKDVIKHAKQKLKKEMYDVILLDYLLGEKQSASREREFGHELLEGIHKPLSADKDIYAYKGPMEHFWIFPISVFTYAMIDELHEKGIGHFSEHWYLCSGADPVNTPNLFKYKLFRFMKTQLYQAGIQAEFTTIKNNPPDENSNIRDWASTILGKLLLEFGNKKKLFDDALSGGSVFAKSVLCELDEIHYYEHLQHLIYLLAHGSGLEWAEMWDELSYLKSSQNYAKEMPGAFFQSVENHIIKLQQKYS